MKKILLTLLVIIQIAQAELSGFAAVGLGYKENIFTNVQDSLAPSFFAILRNENYFVEGNRLTYGLGFQYQMNFALFSRFQNGLLDTGLQVTKHLFSDLFLQVNSFVDIRYGGLGVESMLFRRFASGDLEFIPSIALEYDDAKHSNSIFEVNKSSVNIEVEFLTVYTLNESFNIASTLFYNLYDEKIQQNPLIAKREVIRFSIGLGYIF